jgi:signal peptidase II
MPRLLPYILKISLPLIIIDQITKWWVVLNFKNLYPSGNPESPGIVKMVIIDDFLNFIRVHNQGVAFGMGNGSAWAPIVFLIVPFVALTAIIILWKKKAFVGISKYSAPLLVAGIVGNLIDRLLQGFWLEAYQGMSFWKRLSEGYVVDFIDVKLPFKVPFTDSYHWPCFNVADSCICIAATLLFISAFRPEQDGSEIKPT